MSTVMLQREWSLQMARKAPGRTGGYPGLFWAAIALSLPLLHQALVTYRLDFLPDRRSSLELAGFWLIGLTCLRACMGCAASMAEEVQHHSAQLVRQLPRSGGMMGLLMTKIAVTSLPIVLEWALFGGLIGLLWLLGVPVQDYNPQRFVAVGLTSMFFFSSLGLWIGARLGDPERAVNNARVAVIMTLVGWALLEGVLKGPLLLIAALIWVAFMFRSSPRVASAFQGGVISAVVVLLLPQAYMLGDLRLAQLSPLMAAFHPDLTRDDCVLYCVGAVAILLLNLRQLRKL
ncbi:hypothetical protein ABS71_01440 [bacterium SCN 62-11]|nr:MAG: hypothetical protein ABS71_01440 [bacterium SCN 62-11]